MTHNVSPSSASSASSSSPSSSSSSSSASSSSFFPFSFSFSFSFSFFFFFERYLESETLWEQPCDLVFPCALSNQIDGAAAETLASGGCKGVIEGAHAPCTADAIKIFKQNGMHFAPHKATMACGGFLGGHTLEVWKRNLRA